MTSEIVKSSLLGLSDSGEYLLTRLELEALHDVGPRTYEQLFAHLVAQNPGFEFSMEDDFKTLGIKLKWRKIKC